jgi:putative addiction module killer protein
MVGEVHGVENQPLSLVEQAQDRMVTQGALELLESLQDPTRRSSNVGSLTGCRMYTTISLMENQERNLRMYVRKDGKIPYQDWFLSLKDKKAAAKIANRLDLLRLGHLGKHRVLGGGLAELKIDFGPGYRVYIGLAGPVLVILLCGGDKNRQSKDIETVKTYWNDYRDKDGED